MTLDPMRQPAEMSMAEPLSAMDALLAIVRNLRLIVGTTIAAVVLGLLIAILSPSKYTATAQVIREITDQNSLGGLAGAGLLRGLGINLGGSTTGVTADTYPAILMSLEVRSAVAHSTFYFADIDSNMTLMEYYTLPPGLVKAALGFFKKYTLGLPGTIINSFSDNPARTFGDSSWHERGQLVVMKEKEKELFEELINWISVRVDRNTGIMSISATTKDPLFSASLVMTFIVHLTERIQALYSEKAIENLDFIRERFKETEVELEIAEQNLARFLDRNQDPRTAKLLTEMDRLKRILSFKTQLYADLQTQLTQAEIELQRSRPVITLLEAPVPPLERSAPKRTMIVIISFILGIGLGLGLTYTRELISTMQTSRSQSWKLAELKKVASQFWEGLSLKRVLVFWRRPKP